MIGLHEESSLQERRPKQNFLGARKKYPRADIGSKDRSFCDETLETLPRKTGAAVVREDSPASDRKQGTGGGGTSTRSLAGTEDEEDAGTAGARRVFAELQRFRVSTPPTAGAPSSEGGVAFVDSHSKGAGVCLAADIGTPVAPSAVASKNPRGTDGFNEPVRFQRFVQPQPEQ